MPASKKKTKESSPKKVDLMDMRQLVRTLTQNKLSPFSISTDHSIQGMGDSVIKISSVNTSDTVCYINIENNKIFFSKPVSFTVLNEIIDFVNQKEKVI
jgi:hypothetical protein